MLRKSKKLADLHKKFIMATSAPATLIVPLFFFLLYFQLFFYSEYANAQQPPISAKEKFGFTLTTKNLSTGAGFKAGDDVRVNIKVGLKNGAGDYPVTFKISSIKYLNGNEFLDLSAGGVGGAPGAGGADSIKKSDITFDPASASVGYPSTLTMKTSVNLPEGEYKITLEGTAEVPIDKSDLTSANKVYYCRTENIIVREGGNTKNNGFIFACSDMKNFRLADVQDKYKAQFIGEDSGGTTAAMNFRRDTRKMWANELCGLNKWNLTGATTIAGKPPSEFGPNVGFQCRGELDPGGAGAPGDFIYEKVVEKDVIKIVIQNPKDTFEFMATPEMCGSKTLALSWDKVEGASKYYLFRNGEQVAEVPAIKNMQPIYIDSALDSGGLYKYRVVAWPVNRISKVVFAQAPQECVPVPGFGFRIAPDNLSVKAGQSVTGNITVSLTPASNKEDVVLDLTETPSIGGKAVLASLGITHRWIKNTCTPDKGSPCNDISIKFDVPVAVRANTYSVMVGALGGTSGLIDTKPILLTVTPSDPRPKPRPGILIPPGWTHNPIDPRTGDPVPDVFISFQSQNLPVVGASSVTYPESTKTISILKGTKYFVDWRRIGLGTFDRCESTNLLSFADFINSIDNPTTYQSGIYTAERRNVYTVKCIKSDEVRYANLVVNVVTNPKFIEF